MRILINGAPMLGRLTGVGQYGLKLLEALARLGDEGIDEIGVFDGREVSSAGRFMKAAGQQTSPPRTEGLKRVIRHLWPRCRDLADGLRRRRLSCHTRQSAWSLYHETNFVSPRVDLPLVTTVHDMGYLRYPQFLPRDRLAWLRGRMAQALTSSRVIVADSHFTRRELLELCPQVAPERVLVAQLGVDLDYFSDPLHALRLAEVRRKLRLPDRFSLYLGTLEPRKNLQGLVRAYGRLPAELQREYPLVVAGMKGWNQSFFRRELEQLCDRGCLHEVGYVDQADVPVLMKAATVFCFPSFYEGFGLPPLEAAACGTPVLSSHAASLPEVLGDAAMYVDPASPDSIAAGLRRLLEDDHLRGRLRVAGPARAALFPWRKCAQQTLAAYRAAA